MCLAGFFRLQRKIVGCVCTVSDSTKYLARGSGARINMKLCGFTLLSDLKRWHQPDWSWLYTVHFAILTNRVPQGSDVRQGRDGSHLPFDFIALAILQALLCGPIMVIVGIVFLASAAKDTRTADINTYNSAVSGERLFVLSVKCRCVCATSSCESSSSLFCDCRCCYARLQAGRRVATKTMSTSATMAPTSSTARPLLLAVR